MNNIWKFINTDLIFLIWFLVFFYFIYSKMYKQIAKLVISSVLILIIIFFMKEFYLVPRPFKLSGAVPSSGMNLFSSFPSLHAAWAFMLATVAIVVFKRISLEVLAILGAVFFSVLRVFSRSHNLLDIGFGALIGVLITFYVFEALEV